MKPSKVKVHKISRCLELVYDTQSYSLPYEFLRVHSPSAEVRGHGKGNEILQYAKQDVNIKNIEPTGNYAVKIVFDDGHDSGLYTWEYLYELCINQTQWWATYLAKLESAGLSRQANTIGVKQL
jgi:DUF971 family protein